MKLLTFINILLLQTTVQETTFLMTSDKVYSILTVLLIIFGLVIGYLVLTGRKISKLEKLMDSWNKE